MKFQQPEDLLMARPQVSNNLLYLESVYLQSILVFI